MTNTDADTGRSVSAGSPSGVSHGSPASGRAARVLIVDDHPAVREGLAIRIARQADLEVCGEAADLAEALEQVTATRPDVVVIDISLKSGNGIDLIKKIKANDPSIRMLVWSMHPEALYAERALRAGGQGVPERGDGGACAEPGRRPRRRACRRFAGRVSVRPRTGGLPVDRPGAGHAEDRREHAGQPEDGRDLPGAHQGETEPEQGERTDPACGAVGDGKRLKPWTVGRGPCHNLAPQVVTRSPDRVTLLTAGLPGVLASKEETCGQIPWHGQETVPQPVLLWFLAPRGAFSCMSC